MNSTVAVLSTDLKVPASFTVDRTDAPTFPALDRVIPAEAKDGTIKLCLGVNLLETLLKAAKTIRGDKHDQGIVIEVPTNQTQVKDAMRFSITGDDVEAYGAIMPMRI